MKSAAEIVFLYNMEKSALADAKAGKFPHPPDAKLTLEETIAKMEAHIEVFEYILDIKH
jgi:hypothetical protein